jgi:UDP-N-acetylglucosamine pyrophosphorylase
VSNVDNSVKTVDKLLEMVDISRKTVEILTEIVDKSKIQSSGALDWFFSLKMN